MKKLVITIGITGCGKSTWLKDMFPVVETDDIRKELFGNIDDISEEKLIFETAKERIVNLFKKNDTVYFGATMVETKHRANFLADIKKMCIFDFEIYAVIFKSNPEVSKKRIKGDLGSGVDRANSIELIDRQYKFYLETLEVIKKEKIYKQINYQ